MEELEIKPPNKSEKILRISFWILIIAVILLLGAWAAKLVLLSIG